MSHEREAARSRIAVALDVPDLDQAAEIAAAVSPHVGVAKVGLQLFSAHGPAAVNKIRATGINIFLDVKLHDIPNTVRSAAVELGKLGVQYLTVHASGGEPMMRGAVEGLAHGAELAGVGLPMVLAVTILTSDTEAPQSLLVDRVEAAGAAGCGGLVCAAPDLDVVRPIAQDRFLVTPGIRFHGGEAHDQARVATPGAAVGGGADLLVIGRAITGATDPAAAASRAAKEVAQALGQ